MGDKKRNALTHGANAKEVMLWSEKYEDYEALRDGLCQEFKPTVAVVNVFLAGSPRSLPGGR
jgi:hypothetical protein